MDSLSSSFNNIIQLSNNNTHHQLILTPIPRLHVSSLKTNDKPQTAATKAPETPRAPPLASISRLPTTILNTFDNIINTFIDPPRKPSIDPRYVLSDNFAPVDELLPTPCQVIEGSLPPALDGAYIRNGPNPQFLPRGPYHLFDGDGMLHAITISAGRATLCSRYVQTYKYKTERQHGSPIIPNVFSGFNGLSATAARSAVAAGRILAGQFNPAQGIGLANTSLALISGRLYAMGESDLPYAVRVDPNDGEIHTIGRHDFSGKLAMSMTAHPKIDPVTKETFAFRYGPMPPFLKYFTIDPNGDKRPDVPIFSMTSLSLIHDFAITRKYAIFNEIQIGLNPRIGVLPRYAADESEMRWFEAAGLNVIHAINAWDEDDGKTIVMMAPNILPVEHTLERMDLLHSSIEKVKIDLRNGTVSRHPISTMNLDFGVINLAFVGRKNKYMYAAVGDPMPKVSGVAKLDVSVANKDRRDCTVATRMFGPGCFGGEPFFVARHPENPNADEDDGYVVTYVHNENTGESRFLVMDAKSPNLDTVAAVRLPRRIPYGFHGLFIRQSDLNNL